MSRSTVPWLNPPNRFRILRTSPSWSEHQGDGLYRLRIVGQHSQIRPTGDDVDSRPRITPGRSTRTEGSSRNGPPDEGSASLSESGVPARVVTGTQGYQMARIDASRVLALAVDVEVVWDQSDQDFVGVAMSDYVGRAASFDRPAGE